MEGGGAGSLKPLSVEVVDNVAILKLERPEKLNALNRELWSSLREALTEKCESSVDGIVLTGSGRAFSSSDDIGEMYNLESLGDALEFFDLVKSTVEALAGCGKPVVAAVNGLAAGGGAEILLLADYVIASRGSWISFPESRIGLIPPLLLTVGVDVIGFRRARQLAITGDRIADSEALELGLIDKIVEREELLKEAIKTAKEMSTLTPASSLKAIKTLSLEKFKASLDGALRALAELSIGKDAKERMKAFLEKKLKPPE
ncbi:MAG: enoyl-CoA hydratase/isomerase family protein [Thermoprotei archaeon]|nr:enoyl-CoA hydratase/isomerase family protein [Thermoprotei archaeon]